MSHLQGPVRATDFAFEAPSALLTHPSPFADPMLHTRAIADLEDAARRIGGADGLIRDLERLAAISLPRRLGEDEAARRLGLSRRTLVRRLSAAHVEFRGLIDGVLRDKARAMLDARKLSRDSMAEALGYADPTSFSRACRRWFLADDRPRFPARTR
jgi:AraC-like DNA-binding protein